MGKPTDVPIRTVARPTEVISIGFLEGLRLTDDEFPSLRAQLPPRMSAWFVRLIKIQQRWVRFSAIDAWILIEVSIDLGRELLATLDSISPDASCIRRAAEIPSSSVLPVVLASVRGETFPTPRLQLRRAAPAETRRAASSRRISCTLP
jgi:hypothetical protein